MKVWWIAVLILAAAIVVLLLRPRPTHGTALVRQKLKILLNDPNDKARETAAIELVNSISPPVGERLTERSDFNGDGIIDDLALAMSREKVDAIRIELAMLAPVAWDKKLIQPAKDLCKGAESQEVRWEMMRYMKDIPDKAALAEIQKVCRTSASAGARK